jgi:sugar phosphate isomerase/epimerase
VSPGLFKSPAPAGPGALARGIREALPRALDAARDFGCHRILLFVPDRPAGHSLAEPAPGWLREGLREAAELAAAAGLRLCLENEPGTWADTGTATRHLLAAVDHPHLRANWDPANALCAGETRVVTGGYRAIRPWVDHIHVKDAPRPDPDGTFRFVPLGQGEVPWDAQLAGLAAENYQGFLTIETHCEPLATNTPSSLRELRRLLAGTPIP